MSDYIIPILLFIFMILLSSIRILPKKNMICSDKCQKKAMVRIDGKILIAIVTEMRYEYTESDGALWFTIQFGYVERRSTVKIEESRAKEIMKQVYSEDNKIIDLTELNIPERSTKNNDR